MTEVIKLDQDFLLSPHHIYPMKILLSLLYLPKYY